MSASVNGVDEIVKQLKKEFGLKFSKVENKALKEGAKVVGLAIFRELEPFKDTGSTLEEITIGNPTKRGGFKHILVGWSGPMERYRLVHLNEFGYTRDGKHYNPRMKGAIQRAIDKSRPLFKKKVEEELRKHL